MGVFKLQSPIAFGNEEITELTYPDKIIMTYLRGTRMPPEITDDAMLVVKNCTKQPMGVIDRMEYFDFDELAALIFEKMKKKPSTKTESS